MIPLKIQKIYMNERLKPSNFFSVGAPAVAVVRVIVIA